MAEIREIWLRNRRKLFQLRLLISIISFTHVGLESIGEQSNFRQIEVSVDMVAQKL